MLFKIYIKLLFLINRIVTIFKKFMGVLEVSSNNKSITFNYFLAKIIPFYFYFFEDIKYSLVKIHIHKNLSRHIIFKNISLSELIKKIKDVKISPNDFIMEKKYLITNIYADDKVIDIGKYADAYSKHDHTIENIFKVENIICDKFSFKILGSDEKLLTYEYKEHKDKHITYFYSLEI